MTAKELAQKLGRNESTIVQHFARTKRTFEKYGIILDKVRGKDEYTLTYKGGSDDSAAT